MEYSSNVAESTRDNNDILCTMYVYEYNTILVFTYIVHYNVENVQMVSVHFGRRVASTSDYMACLKSRIEWHFQINDIHTHTQTWYIGNDNRTTYTYSVLIETHCFTSFSVLLLTDRHINFWCQPSFSIVISSYNYIWYRHIHRVLILYTLQFSHIHWTVQHITNVSESVYARVCIL